MAGLADELVPGAKNKYWRCPFLVNKYLLADESINM